MGEKRGMKALEAWCRKVTEGYRDVSVVNMTTSWRDGLAFCAIIHHFRPDLIEYDTLSKENVQQNNELAFNVAEKHLGIPSLLDAEDMVKYKVPDKLSIMTYVSQFYQYFQGSGQNGSPMKSPKRHVESSSSRSTSPESPPSKVPVICPSAVRQPDVCQACSNRVYILERLIIENKLYHRTCFKCCRCQSLLKPGSYVDGPKPGQYECASCPDEEEAEKAAIASMTAARLAHIGSPVYPGKLTPLPKRSPVKNEDMKLSLAIADARKAFLTSPQRTEINTPAAAVTDSETNHSQKLAQHMQVVSPYLFGEKESKVSLSVKAEKEKKIEDSKITATSSDKQSEMKNEEMSKLKQESQDKEICSDLQKQVSESNKVSFTEVDQYLAKNTVENSEKSVTKNEINIILNDKVKEKNVNSLNDCDLKSLENSIQINNTQNDSVSEEQKSNDQLTPDNNVHPVPSPRSFQRKQTSTISCDKITDKISEDIFVTPQASPELRFRKQKLDLKLHELLSEPTPATEKEEISVNQAVSSTVSSVHQVRLSSIETTPSPSRSQIIVHDMPLIQPHISHHILSPTREKKIETSNKMKIVNDESATTFKERDIINEPNVELKHKKINEISVEKKSELFQVDKSEKKSEQLLSDELSLTDIDSSSNAASLSENFVKIETTEKSSIEDEKILQSPSVMRASSISSESSENRVTSPIQSDKSPSKKTPPPRPQLPSILIKSPNKSPTSSQVERSNTSYPEDLNPFGADDDEGEEPVVKSDVVKKVAVKSLNPFEDSEDEFEDALKPEDLVTASKKVEEVSVPRKEMIKIEAPKGLNPFEDEEDEESTEHFPLSHQELSHDDHKSRYLNAQVHSAISPASADRPVPLPRRSVGTRSSSQSPVSSLGRSSGMKYASATSSPVGSLSKASGKRHTLSGGSSPAVSPVNSLSKATGQRCSSSRDSGLDISPMGTLSKNRKKRPAPKPPTARTLFSFGDSSTEMSKGEDELCRRTSTPLPKSSPCCHKKFPAPPPPVLLNNKDVGMSEKTLKDLDNINLKSTRIEGSKIEKSNDEGKLCLPVDKMISSSQKNTFGYWKKKKPAPPIPLPPKRQITKIPLDEIQQELADIETKQLDLEQRGVELEKRIREGEYSGEDETNAEDEDLVLQLFELVNQKNILFRRQAELVYMKRQQRLEEEHAELEFQIRCLMDKSVKTKEEMEQEEELIKRLIEVVAQRNEIIESIEIDRVKEAMEDESIQEQMAVRQAGSSRSSLNSQGSSNSIDHLGKKEKKKKEKEMKKSAKNKEKEKMKAQDEDKDLDDTEVRVKDKNKKDKKRKWF